MAHGYRDLVVWQRASELAVLMRTVVRAFPPDERFVLGSQLRRAADSIVANIAEGYGRRTRKDYIHFLTLARGSLTECDAEIEVAARLSYITDALHKNVVSLLRQIGYLLARLITSLQPPL